MKLGKLIAVIITINLCNLTAFADQKPSEPAHKITNLGNGLYMETIPAEYGTFVSDFAKSLEQVWILQTPTVYETITTTIIVKEAYTKIDIKPAEYNDDQSLKTPARANLTSIPPITRNVTQRIIKTDPKWVKRAIPIMDHPPTIRKQIKPAHYIIRNTENETVQEFTDIKALADFLNTRE